MQSSRGSQSTFPVQLHYLLSEAETDGISNVVSFSPHGRSFIVHNVDVFVEAVLPNWFRQSKYTSFQRQLNIYSFKRITAGPDKNAYYHPWFLRGFPDLAAQIRRNVVPGTGPSEDVDPAKFYELPPLAHASRLELPPTRTATMSGALTGTSTLNAIDAQSRAFPWNLSTLNAPLHSTGILQAHNTERADYGLDVPSQFGFSVPPYHSHQNNLTGALIGPTNGSSRGLLDPRNLLASATLPMIPLQDSWSVDSSRFVAAPAQATWNQDQVSPYPDLRHALMNELQLHRRLPMSSYTPVMPTGRGEVCFNLTEAMGGSDHASIPLDAAHHPPTLATLPCYSGVPGSEDDPELAKVLHPPLHPRRCPLLKQTSLRNESPKVDCATLYVTSPGHPSLSAPPTPTICDGVRSECTQRGNTVAVSDAQTTEQALIQRAIAAYQKRKSEEIKCPKGAFL